MQRKNNRLAIALMVLSFPSLGVQAADVFKGAQLFTSYCAGCHGADGKGLLPGTPDFTQGMALMKPDTMLVATIKSGKGAMPAFTGILTDPNLLDVIAHLRTLQR